MIRRESGFDRTIGRELSPSVASADFATPALAGLARAV